MLIQGRLCNGIITILEDFHVTVSGTFRLTHEEYVFVTSRTRDGGEKEPEYQKTCR